VNLSVTKVGMSSTLSTADLFGSDDSEAEDGIKLTAPRKAKSSDNLFGDDSDEDSIDSVANNVTPSRINALFGSDSENESNEDITPSSQKSPKRPLKSENVRVDNTDNEVPVDSTDPSKYHALDDIFGESAEKEEVIVKGFLDLEFYKSAKLHPDTVSYVLKVPNFLSTQGPNDSNIENKFVIKCKWGNGTHTKIDSNARFIKWSDGTFSLIVGGMVFDASGSDISNGYIYSLQKSQLKGEESGPSEHLNSLECVSECTQRIILHSGDGTSAAHSVLASTIASKYNVSKSIENIGWLYRER
jgi:Leo1-like protein